MIPATFISKINLVAALAVACIGCGGAERGGDTADTIAAQEMHRPRFHYSPKEAWMNDPNGMVYHNGTYHLFFQHNPDSTVWGPMHWAHATSKDLVHWEHQPIALFPDSLGTIFSGSAVVDRANTAGFGENALVAIFTHANREAADRTRSQYQSLAYSTDEGKIWTKYEGNPVLPNPGIRNFRDPKVIWHEARDEWVMALATGQTITFYASPNLKEWSRLSEFGEGIGAHTGVWECPDLIPFTHNGKTVWVLFVSINPGGPNNGSATQYFVGDFDGTTFTPFDAETRWLDYGRDNYAGVTWSNTDDRRLFIGWMNNWQYANVVPTDTWRGATTLPRELGVTLVEGKWYLTAAPVPELSSITTAVHEQPELEMTGKSTLKTLVGELPETYRLDFTADADADFVVTLKNDNGQWLDIGYKAMEKQFYIDRTHSSDTAFSDEFASVDIAPRIGVDDELDLSIWVDVASVEVFADGGLTVMTEVFFPVSPYNDIVAQNKGSQPFTDLSIYRVASIWE